MFSPLVPQGYAKVLGLVEFDLNVWENVSEMVVNIDAFLVIMEQE